MANPELLLLSERDAHGGGNNFRRSNTTAHGRRAATLPRTEMHHNVTAHQLHAACFPQPEVAHQHVRHTGATASDWPMAGLVFATPTKDQASQRQPCERKGQATNCGLHSTVSRSHPCWTEDTTRLALPCTLHIASQAPDTRPGQRVAASTKGSLQRRTSNANEMGQVCWVQRAGREPCWTHTALLPILVCTASRTLRQSLGQGNGF